MTTTILAIDDDPEILDLYTEILSTSGYSFATAVNGFEGWERIQALQPDVILTDWSMPFMSGADVLAKVKSHPRHAPTYAIVVTGLHDAETKMLGFEAGADDYLIKPFDKIELLARVRVGLRIREMQRSLKREVHLLSQAMKQSPVSIVITDTGGNIVFVNSHFTRTTGFEAAEIMCNHTNPRTSVNGNGANAGEWSMHDLVRKRPEFHGELCSHRKDGGLIWESVHASPIKNANGKVSHYLTIRVDITGQKLAEEAQRDSDERFRCIAESTHDAIIVADINGKITFWNKGAQSIFGYAELEILGKEITAIVPERFHDRHRKGMERFLAVGDTVIIGDTVEMFAVRRDGSEFPIELSLSAWGSNDKRSFAAIIRDITKRKKVEPDGETKPYE